MTVGYFQQMSESTIMKFLTARRNSRMKNCTGDGWSTVERLVAEDERVVAR